MEMKVDNDAGVLVLAKGDALRIVGGHVGIEKSPAGDVLRIVALTDVFITAIPLEGHAEHSSRDTNVEDQPGVPRAGGSVGLHADDSPTT